MRRDRWPAVPFLLAACLTTTAAHADDAPVEVRIQGEGRATTGDTDDVAASSHVDARALRLPGAATVDALSVVPSLTIVRTGSAFDVTSVSLRGGTSAETPVFLAGIPLNDEATGTADLALLPPFFLRSLDVYRGLAPIGDAPIGMSGAIHAEPAFPQHTQAIARFGAGSFGRTSQAVGASVADARGGVTLAVRRIAAQNDFDYVDDRGTRFVERDDVVRERDNADAAQLDLWALGRARLGNRGALRFVVNALHLDQGVSGLAAAPARAARGEKERALAGASMHVRCLEDARDDGCVVEAEVHGARTAVTISDPSGELAFFPGGRATVETFRHGTEVAVRLVPIAPLRFRVGAGYSGARLALVAQGTRARRSTARAFGDVVADLGAGFGLVGGAAVASDRMIADASDQHLLLDARAGATFSRAYFDASLVFARLARAPTLGERYGLSDSLLGNPDLRMESALALEARIAARSAADAPHVGAELVGFGRLADDLVVYRRTSLATYRPDNVAEARVLGLEGSLDVVPVEPIVFGARLALVDAVNPEAPTTEKALPLVARFSSAVFARAETPPLAASAGLGALDLGVTFVFRSERAVDPAGLVVLPNALGLDADASVALANGMTRVAVRASNLLDDRTTDVLGYPLPGRSLFVDIEGRWP